MTESSTWGAQLAHLRHITETTGVIHEAQAMQLRMWPIAALPFVRSSEVQVNLDGKVVRILCRKDEAVEIDGDVDVRYRTLGNWMQFLLGPSWMITIELDGNLVYTHFAQKESEVVGDVSDTGGVDGPTPLSDPDGEE